MRIVRTRRAATAAGMLISGVVISTAAASVQNTVTARLIKPRPGTLRFGTQVRASSLFGNRVFTTRRHGFALADVNGAQYPAATLDAGNTWRTDGPALHLNAAQAPLVVLEIGATSQKRVFAYGGGNVIDTTSDGGRRWYAALFQGLVMAVVRGASGHLVAFVDQQTGTMPGTTLQYVSRDGGRSWHYNTRVGGS
jgi:hypothetical protein